MSGFDDENEELGKKRSVRYLCAVEVTLPNHGVRTRGVGLSEADVESGAGSFWLFDFVSQRHAADGLHLQAAILINVLFHGRRSSGVCHSHKKSSEARSRQSFVQCLSEDTPCGFR